ncbi:hypothetical protein Misp01_28000 [Microtetraspora sp. NBRC 13810]|nr:hypothetical protein Misp01_28000 [Microtetraspora sp. NBRC 13810]
MTPTGTGTTPEAPPGPYSVAPDLYSAAPGPYGAATGPYGVARPARTSPGSHVLADGGRRATGSYGGVAWPDRAASISTCPAGAVQEGAGGARLRSGMPRTCRRGRVT